MTNDTTVVRSTLSDVARRVNASGTGRGTTIALIDTGVAPTPLLDGANIVVGPDFSSESEFGGLDTNGHGTHLAGIITTLAPEARLLSLRAGETEGATHPTAVIAAIDWLVDEAPQQGLGAEVLVLAYSVDAHLPEAAAVEAAVTRAWDAGIAVVVAAGNTGTVGVTAPATVQKVITVGGEGGIDAFELGNFSSRGDLGRKLDLLAPGRSVVSARAIGAKADEVNEAGRVGEHLVAATGSSQSAAVVGAALALVNEGRTLTNEQLKAVLISSARPVEGCEAGMLDVAQARSLAGMDQSPSIEAALDTVGRFATRWAGASWAGASWAGTRWTGASWAGASWAGASWAGASWAGTRWTGASWAGTRWTGASWAGASWAGASWAGASWAGTRWTGASWAGTRWTGASWAGASWAGASWAGTRWTGASWAGTRWTGASWAGASWAGASWAGASWAGTRWTGASWAGTRWTGASWAGASWAGASWAGASWA